MGGLVKAHEARLSSAAWQLRQWRLGSVELFAAWALHRWVAGVAHARPTGLLVVRWRRLRTWRVWIRRLLRNRRLNYHLTRALSIARLATWHERALRRRQLTQASDRGRLAARTHALRRLVDVCRKLPLANRRQSDCWRCFRRWRRRHQLRAAATIARVLRLRAMRRWATFRASVGHRHARR